MAVRYLIEVRVGVEVSKAFYRCSYLAKARGKGYGGLGANNYSGSRVRSKADSVMIDENAKVGQQTRPLERVATAMCMD